MNLLYDILSSIGTRLETIKTANGYATNINEVYIEKIPMGLSLEPHELPAVLLIPGLVKIDPKGQNKIYCEWVIYLQLIHDQVSTLIMFDFVKEIAKAIFANSPSANRQDEYRLINPSVYKMDISHIEPDLNMIDANRFSIMELNVKFITQYNEL